MTKAPPEIFLSYNREDASVAKLFADAFAREGLEVWWDQTLRSGDDYDEVTEQALHSARAVVVLWSPRSVVSRWVRAEATVAEQNKTLAPVTIEACRRPVMFELKQTADLSHWRGRADDPAWRAFVGDVRRMLGRDAGERGVATPQAVAKAVPRPLRRYAPILAALLLILAAGLTYAFVRSRGTDPVSASQAALQAGKVSVAVLPFRNLSADKDQEFFSDGMTEEITSALAKVPGLNVVSRTSAFQFKGASRDMRAIGQALGASHLIEGSVRKEGNALRITAQLVKADDGKGLWSESYDRELKGVFALQEEIAKAIAGALRVPLGLKAGQSLVANRTADSDSYQDYLRARALVRGRGRPEPGGPLTQAAKLLEQAVARDPNYAPAWAMLAHAYVATIFFTDAFFDGSTDELRQIVSNSLQKAETAAQKAIQLDPNNADAYAALAGISHHRGRLVEAEELFERALSLDAENPDALSNYSLALARAGRLKEALALRRRLQAQEPLVPIFNAFTGLVLWTNGQNDEAIALLKAIPPTPVARDSLAQVYASMGRYNDAAEALQRGALGKYRLEEAAGLLRTAPAKAVSSPTILSKGRSGWVYFYVGHPDRALDHIEAQIDAGLLGGPVSPALWAPAYAPVRMTLRFRTLMRKAGLVEYWRERGWPEACRPVGDDDFTCS